MRSLREIGDFVGVAEDSLEFGYPSFIGLRYAAEVIARADPAAGTPSMRQIDAALTDLEPVTFEAQLLSFVDRQATVRVNTSQGLVIGTRIFARSSTGIPAGHEKNHGSAGGDYRIPGELARGNWTVIARRTGVGPTGFVAFERTFPVVSPPEGRTEPEPVSQTPPQIEVATIRDPERAWAVAFRITGSGFEPNLVSRREGEGVHVRAVLRQQFQERGPFWTSSDAQGRIDHTTGQIDVRQLPRDALGQATLVFSACDRRVVPPRKDNLWSNAVAIDL